MCPAPQVLPHPSTARIDQQTCQMCIAAQGHSSHAGCTCRTANIANNLVATISTGRTSTLAITRKCTQYTTSQDICTHCYTCRLPKRTELDFGLCRSATAKPSNAASHNRYFTNATTRIYAGACAKGHETPSLHLSRSRGRHLVCCKPDSKVSQMPDIPVEWRLGTH